MNFGSNTRSPQARLRCALCGTDEFNEGAMQLCGPGGRRGMLCDRCVLAVDRDPRMREGVALAIGAGVVIADLVGMRGAAA